MFFAIPVRIRVTLRLTVSQPVSLGVEPLLGLMTIFFSPIYIYDHFGLCPVGAPSLTRGWICHLSKSLSCKNIYIVINMYSIIYIIQNYICTVCTRPLSVQAL
jgi:hypothetical protein